MSTTISKLLEQTASAVPDRVALIHSDSQLSFESLLLRSQSAAAYFRSCGLRSGDILSMELPSSDAFVLAYLGAIRCGAIVSAINPQLGTRSRNAILKHTAPRLRVGAVRRSDEARRDSDTDINLEMLQEGIESNLLAPPVSEIRDLEAPVCIVWTSGTTGFPKGAVYSTRAMHVISDAMGDWTAPRDVRLLTLPFAHVGFMTRMIDELRNQVTMVVGAEPWSASRQLDLMERHSVTVMGGVPTQWHALLEEFLACPRPTQSLRIVGIGAAPASPELISSIRETFGCPIIVRYTSTEAGITTGTRLGDSHEVIGNTIGRAAPGVAIRIQSNENALEPRTGISGELCCRSRAMMSEYFRDPSLTATAIDSEGWLHTGDLVEVRADGNLRHLGRTNDMYLRGGYNVYPTEIEHCLESLAGVASIAIVAVPHERLGEIGVACIVPVDGASSPSLETLRAKCTSELGKHKAPDELQLFASLPLTPMGKLDRIALTAAVNERRGIR